MMKKQMWKKELIIRLCSLWLSARQILDYTETELRTLYFSKTS